MLGTLLHPLGTVPGDADLEHELEMVVGWAVACQHREGALWHWSGQVPHVPIGMWPPVFSLMSPLHGVTFLAFGNGAPDVFSAVVAFSDPRTAGLAIGAVFGKENPTRGCQLRGVAGGGTLKGQGVFPPEGDLLCWQVLVCL